MTNRVLGSILTGATEQMNCSSCSSGFASFGSFALGVHGRWTLTPNIEVLAGGSYDSYSAKGVSSTTRSIWRWRPRYDMVQLGRYRPFFEAESRLPLCRCDFARNYVPPRRFVGGRVDAVAIARGLRAGGYIFRLSRSTRPAAYTDITRTWQHTDGYLEPHPAAIRSAPGRAEPGHDEYMEDRRAIHASVRRAYRGQYERRLCEAFDADYGADAVLSGFGAAAGTAPSSFGWPSSADGSATGYPTACRRRLRARHGRRRARGRPNPWRSGAASGVLRSPRSRSGRATRLGKPAAASVAAKPRCAAFQRRDRRFPRRGCLFA